MDSMDIPWMSETLDRVVGFEGWWLEGRDRQRGRVDIKISPPGCRVELRSLNR